MSRLISTSPRLTDLGVDHLSVYDLQYEPGTPFGQRFPEAGDGGRPSSEGAAEMYEAVPLVEGELVVIYSMDLW